MLQSRQIRLYQRIQRMPRDDLMRSLVCDSDGYPRNWDLERKRGRPKDRWGLCVFRLVSI